MIDIAEAAELVRRYEKDRDKRSRDGSPRDFVEEVRHVLDGGLSNADFRTLQKTAEACAVMSKLAMRIANEGRATSADAQPAPKNVFYRVGHRVGDFWEIAFAGQRTHLKDSDGFRYIHYLLQRPNLPVEVVSLRQLGSRQHRPDAAAVPAEPGCGMTSEGDADAVPTQPGGGRGMTSEGDAVPAKPAGRRGSRGRMTSDEEAARQYKADLERVEQNIARAHEAGDYATVVTLRAHCDFLERELRQAGRPLGDDRKRAQESVQKAIAAALRRIAEDIPRLATYLRRSIDTGYQCLYTPDPDRAMDWILKLPDSKRISPTTRNRQR